MEEKLKWDCYYVDHVSFMLDLKIIVWTIKSVVLQKNIHSNE
ncbi:MAG: sugar transferase, partial [Lachnospiraceae bacterium]|nr:sugar transferase [Lachnospiraceae bacterium]